LAEEKSELLLKEIVSADPRFHFEDNYVVVTSNNSKVYKINLNNGSVTIDGKCKCVQVKPGINLPMSDKILAKALAIAYAPERIHTLRN